MTDYIQKLINENEYYSTRQLNIFLFDLDDKITKDYYFKHRSNFRIKTGKYTNTTYYSLVCVYQDKRFTKWFINEGIMSNEHRVFLKLIQKRIEFNNLIERRLKNNEFNGRQKYVDFTEIQDFF